MIAKNPLTEDNYNVLQQIEQENNLTEIRIDRSIFSYFPIFISLGITLFGLYGFIVGLTTNDIIIYSGLTFAGSLILYIESQRTNLLADYYSSLLEKNLNDKVKKSFFSFTMAIIFTFTFIGLDMFGANSMSIYVKSTMVENKVINSKAYKLADKEAKNGTRLQDIYLKELEEWRKAQRMNNFSCASLPKNYVTKKLKCKKDWYNNNPKPKKKDIKSSGDVSSSVYKNLENEAKKSYSKYDEYFYYAFFILSLLLNYLAVSNVFNQYRAKYRELSPEMIEVLRDRYKSMNLAKINKMKRSNEAIDESLDKSYNIDVEIERTNYLLSINKKQMVLSNRKKAVNNILNKSEYIETYPTNKAGFINVSNTKQYIPNGNNTIDYSLFDNNEIELINLLFDNGNIPIGGQLVKRDIVLDTVGHNKLNANRLRDLYSKLMERDYIYKKVAYFSKITV